MIEKAFDVPFVAALAQREKQIQQSYRPVIGVHKWFARRPGTLFRSLMLSEFVNGAPLSTTFFRSHNLKSLVVGDPFMGGGTPLLEANRLGAHVVGTDVNPMAYWVVRQELGSLDRAAFRASAEQVISAVEAELGAFYQTTCTTCQAAAPVKYFLWVKQQRCAACEQSFSLFSTYLLSKNERHPNYVLVCPGCGSLHEVATLKEVEHIRCGDCATPLSVKGPAQRNRCPCRHCGHSNSYPVTNGGPPTHTLFAIEYHCSTCKATHKGRFFKAPDALDQQYIVEAARRLEASEQKWVPDEIIPPGDETARLHRWGYERYCELFNPRQRLGLNLLAEQITGIEDTTIREALLTVFSDTLRYQNMLCRYDSYALKIIDIFSVHGFPVSLLQCENTLLGIPQVGSGGFRHFVEKYDRAKEYCERPFEIGLGSSRKKIYLSQEKIGGCLVSQFPDRQAPKSVYLRATSAEGLGLADHTLDAVMTDPPYFANVQYAELMDFCYVWLKRHLGERHSAFEAASTRTGAELTVNQTEGRDIAHFTEGLSQVFSSFTHALKPGGPFTFTYHHNDLTAYLPIAVALLDAALACTATLPGPAEMGASIHISGTRSSVVDTILVCRTTGMVRASDFEPSLANLKRMLGNDLGLLQQAKLRATIGDARCLLLGHLTRLAVWHLRSEWVPSLPTDAKLALVKEKIEEFCSTSQIELLSRQITTNIASLKVASAK